MPQTRTMDPSFLSTEDAPATLRRYGRFTLIKNAFIRFRYGDGFSHSRALALQLVLALVPLGIAFIGLSSTVRADGVAKVLREVLLRVTPGATDEIVKQTLDQGRTLEQGQLALWIGLGVALLALTLAMGQVERGANRIYGIQRDRPSTSKYLRAAGHAATAGILSVTGFLVIVTGGTVGAVLARTYGWTDRQEGIWLALRFPVGVLLALASFTVLINRAPRRRQPGWSWTGIGAGVALTLWLLFTYLLSLYVEVSGSFGSTYGPLTGIVALLLWANLTSIALFLGIAFSAQLEAVRAGVADPERGDPEEGRAETA
ncbi:MAG: YihY/virulence factor BrkB family protein [Sporichthyaceae bacterium]